MIFDLLMDGKRVVAEAEWIKGTLWIHYNGKTFPHVDESARVSRNKKANGSGRAGDLVSPMPGKITKLLKGAGESVEKGDAVLVMEAMKMEYTLKSEGPGVIQKIHVAVGEMVSLGKTLVQIQAREASATLKKDEPS